MASQFSAPIVIHAKMANGKPHRKHKRFGLKGSIMSGVDGVTGCGQLARYKRITN
jgi:hypothetical protein